ncbi:MAG: GntR family transcriptional regulator, partial [Alphaproteobacteria bacterium]
MKQQPRQLQRSKSLTEQAVEEIRARIVRGDFELGAPLSENTLAAELGVSKTPVREALLHLKSEGLVSIQPQRGSFVFNMSSAEVLELGELRETLELAALRLAADRDARGLADELRAIVANMRLALDRNDVISYRTLDADLHRAFFEHAGNRYLLASYMEIAFRIQA